MDEFDFIKKHLKPLSFEELSFGLEDDVAMLPKENMVFSTDTIVERVHFFENISSDLIAQKLLLCNISDVIAKGCCPKYYSLNLTLPKKNTNEKWLKEFALGLKKIQKKYKIFLLGGDTTTSKDDSLVISATIFASFEKKIIKRSEAKKGQDIWCSGYIGDSFLGRMVLEEKLEKNKYLEEKYHLPKPDLAMIEMLQKYGSASIDVSDGFIQDLEHILKSSDIGAEIDLDKIKLSPEAKKFLKKYPKFRNEIYNSGDDYQVIFTADKKHRKDIFQEMKQKNLIITLIGVVILGKQLKIISRNCSDYNKSGGFKHFF